MRSIVANCSDARVIAALMPLVSHKNALVKAKAAAWFDRCVAHMGSRVCRDCGLHYCCSPAYSEPPHAFTVGHGDSFALN